MKRSPLNPKPIICAPSEYVGVGKFKDSTGKWIDAIIYERDNHIYMREITDFIDKFKKA